MNRSTPLKPVSSKRARENRERTEVVKQVRDRDKVCQASERGLDHKCEYPLDVHEVIPRSAWPKGFLDPDNCVLVCRRAHEWIGDHPDEAEALGLHAKSWDRTDSVWRDLHGGAA